MSRQSLYLRGHRQSLPLAIPGAQTTRSRELYTDSLVKLSQAAGKLEWYYQAFPDDFYDWDLQISPIYTTVRGHAAVLAAGKGGYVFAFDPASGKLRLLGLTGEGEKCGDLLHGSPIPFCNVEGRRERQSLDRCVTPYHDL